LHLFFIIFAELLYLYPPRLSHARTEDRLARLRAVRNSFVMEISQGRILGNRQNVLRVGYPTRVYKRETSLSAEDTRYTIQLLFCAAATDLRRSSSCRAAGRGKYWSPDFPRRLVSCTREPDDKVSGQCIQTTASSFSSTSTIVFIDSSSTTSVCTTILSSSTPAERVLSSSLLFYEICGIDLCRSCVP
jgi:hypothetical protein